VSRFAPAGDTVPAGLGFGVPVAPIRPLPWRRWDLSGSWGILVRSCPVLGPRQDRTCQALRHADAAPALLTTKAPTNMAHFRGSIARLRRSLSSLRSDHRWPPRQTRFRLLAKLYRVGLVTHRIPTKGFRVLPTSLPPFPSFLTQQQVCQILLANMLVTWHTCPLNIPNDIHWHRTAFIAQRSNRGSGARALANMLPGFSAATRR
jgi:hypothetical protein